MHLAEMSFFWHRVYDPRSRTCVHFCDAAPELIGTADVPALPSTTGGITFLGCEIVFAVAVRQFIVRTTEDPFYGRSSMPLSSALIVLR